MDPSAAKDGTDSTVVNDVDADVVEWQAAIAHHAQMECNKRGWRRVVLNFAPSWFSVTTGTGIVSILLHNLPYNADWLRWISTGIFCANVLIFISFTIISLIRYTLFRSLWKAMLMHPVQSLFLGTFPLGLATIINMIVFVCVPVWGDWAAYLAWGLWWVDALCAVGTNFYLPFLVMYKHKTTLSTMTAAWLMPIVPSVIAAASGGVIAGVLPDRQHAIWTVLISYVLWGCGISLSMFTLVLYFHRLTMHDLPPREVIVSVFLPIGPLGQGAFGIMALGKDALKLFSSDDGTPSMIPLAPSAGEIFYCAGILIALVFWGFGLIWLFFAVAITTRRRFPFNIGWWGFTFPLGVYATATTQLSVELPSGFLRVLGTIFSLVVVLLWVVVSVGTVRSSWTGVLFQSSCVPDWEKAHMERLKQRELNSGASV